jgi:uncharacterized repeat protein (TIGR03803 family)
MRPQAPRAVVVIFIVFSAVLGVAANGAAQVPHRLLYSFVGNFPVWTGDGADPQGGLADGKDRYLYGVTVGGGTDHEGMLFRLRPGGTGYETLHSFTDGPRQLVQLPYPLVRDAYGYFYGTRAVGRGSLFRLDMSSGAPVVTTLHEFAVTGRSGPMVAARPWIRTAA